MFPDFILLNKTQVLTFNCCQPANQTSGVKKLFKFPFFKCIKALILQALYEYH